MMFATCGCSSSALAHSASADSESADSGGDGGNGYLRTAAGLCDCSKNDCDMPPGVEGWKKVAVVRR